MSHGLRFGRYARGVRGFPPSVMKFRQLMLARGDFGGQLGSLPQRVATCNGWYSQKVVRVRGQRHSPLKRIGPPRIVRCSPPETEMQAKIEQHYCNSGCHDEAAD